jgi:hypothetical protein
VHGCRFTNHPRSGRRRRDEVGLAFDRRRPGTLWQVEDCAGGAERVGERHEGTTVKHRRASAEVLAHGHLRNDLVWRSADELDAEQLGKRQHLLSDASEHIHSYFS